MNDRRGFWTALFNCADAAPDFVAPGCECRCHTRPVWLEAARCSRQRARRPDTRRSNTLSTPLPRYRLRVGTSDFMGPHHKILASPRRCAITEITGQSGGQCCQQAPVVCNKVSPSEKPGIHPESWVILVDSIEEHHLQAAPLSSWPTVFAWPVDILFPGTNSFTDLHRLRNHRPSTNHEIPAGVQRRPGCKKQRQPVILWPARR